MNLVQENHASGALLGADQRAWSQNLDGLSIDEVRKVVGAEGDLEPSRSHRPVVGPILTWLRKCLWRLFGVKPISQQVTSVMNQILASRLAFRKGTWDRAIFLGIVARNEYRLPESFALHDIVIDIGMHIGGFCFAALMRGCVNVHGFEAERENFDLAVRNLQGFGERVHLYHKAVWRSDRMGDTLFHGGYPPDGNTGGGCILYRSTGERLDLIAFDDIVRDVTGNGQKRIRLVKIDCEGCEFPILLSSRMLHLIDNIHGEYHGGVYPSVAHVNGVGRHTIEELTRHLEAFGFSVESIPTPNSDLGLFFATRG